MDKISPLAWAAIVVIILVAVAVNLWMVALLRHRDPASLNRLLRPKPGRAPRSTLHTFIEVLRDPFAQERKDLQELSRRVEALKKHPPEE